MNKSTFTMALMSCTAEVCRYTGHHRVQKEYVVPMKPNLLVLPRTNSSHSS